MKNHFENAFEALKANRLRTFLTITGVTIGVAGITATLSLVSGATSFLGNQVAESGDKIMLVRPSAQISSSDVLLSDLQNIESIEPLTEHDFKALSEIGETAIASMSLARVDLRPGNDDGTVKSATLVGTNPSLLPIAGLEMFDGEFIGPGSGANSLVLGHQLAIDMFGTEHAIGSLVHARDVSFTVIGVMKPTKEAVGYLGVDFNNSAIVTDAAIRPFTQGVAQIQQVVIQVENSDELSSITQQAKESLLKSRYGEENFAILTSQEVIAPSSQLFSNMSIAIGVIAGISLLVGGIGIMNIMLVNVAERSREVGIRKAIGATSGDIVSQFLIESAIVGLLGGVFGYALGMTSAFILGMHLPFTLVVEWQTAALAIGVSVVTGIIFGIYPAVTASRKHPIEALYQ